MTARVALCGLPPAAARRMEEWFSDHPALQLSVAFCAPDVDALLDRLAASPVHAVILDTGLGLEGLSCGRELAAAGYAVLCTASAPAPAGLRRWAADFGLAFCPEADPARAAALLRRLLGSEARTAAGHVVAFHSPRGGAGTTTLLLQAARRLRDRGQTVAVVEVSGGGGAAPLLGIRPGGGWQELLGVLPEALLGDPAGPERVAAALRAVEPGLFLLPTAGPAAMDELHPDLMEAVLRLLGACGCSWALVDTPAEMTLAAAAALAAADAVCLISIPDAVSAYRLAQVEPLLTSLQVPAERVRLVLNRWREPAPPAVEEVLAYLPYRPAVHVPDDTRPPQDPSGRFAGFRPGGGAARAVDKLVDALVQEVIGA
ncbi:MAG: hypothetical protein DIU55_001370 [Bacillota bacterium]|nr:MAG: hypothetical protein DIU55_01605 [Bacillota bacterium]